jgi:hypothetical protein
MILPKDIWRIEGYERFDRFWGTQLPGHLDEREIVTIVQRLACRISMKTKSLGPH